MTIFARELLGLIRFGYALCKHETLGEVFVCVNKEFAARATLFDYETELKRLDGLGVMGRIQYFTDPAVYHGPSKGAVVVVDPFSSGSILANLFAEVNPSSSRALA